MIAAPTSTRRTVWLLWLLLVVFKCAYAFETLALPFLEGPNFDSLVYLAQADAISHGRFADPTLVAFSPLYGWFLAAAHTLSHTTTIHVLVLQQLLGLCHVFLIYALVQRASTPSRALWSAILFAGYGLFAFYESKILSETLGITLTLLALWFYLHPAFRRGAIHYGLLAGSTFGVAVLARANLLLSAPWMFIAAWLPWTWTWTHTHTRHPWPQRLRRSSAWLAGILLVLGLNGAWNFHHSGVFVPVTLSSNTAVQASQHIYDGSLRGFGHSDPHQQHSPSPWDVVDAAQSKLASASAAAQPNTMQPNTAMQAFNVSGFLRNLPTKFAHTFWDSETTFQYGYYGERSECRTLWLTPFSFGACLVLACFGIVARVRKRGVWSLVPYAPLVLGTLSTTLLFHPSSRYRVPMVLVMLLFAGPGFVSLWSTRRRWRVPIRGALLCMLTFFAWKTMSYTLRDPSLWEVSVGESYVQMGDVASAQDRIKHAVQQGLSEETRNRIQALLLPVLLPKSFVESKNLHPKPFKPSTSSYP